MDRVATRVAGITKTGEEMIGEPTNEKLEELIKLLANAVELLAEEQGNEKAAQLALLAKSGGGLKPQG